MQIITIELLNDHALKLLQQLEQLKVLRLLSPQQASPKKQKRQWAGSISKETAGEMLRNIKTENK